MHQVQRTNWRKTGLIAVALALIIIVAGVVVTAPHTIADSDWPTYGLNSDEQRFSPLVQINEKTVGRLGLAWSLELDQTARTLEATPLEIDGTLYFTTGLSKVYAADALTGKIIWTYDPKPWEHDPEKLQYIQGANRGVAYGEGMIFVGALDGRLIALDSKDGRERWITDTVGGPQGKHKTITGAPRYFNGKVIIGNGGADFGTRGYVTAYDAKSGKQVWRFYTVPGNPADGFEDAAQEMAAKTWSGEWWKWGGGGTAWNSIVFDEEMNRIYVGTGNASNYNPQQRSPRGGDNLFLASIVALDADTGKYIWHYQVNPREAWDYKATADIILATMSIAGKPRKVLMQAPTNGFFYVLDRETGRLISAEKTGKVTWAERIDLVTGRPVEAPNIRYETDKPFRIYPAPAGTHNWQAMSYNPDTKLVYFAADQSGVTFYSTPEDRARADTVTTYSSRTEIPIGVSARHGDPEPGDGTSTLLAWDPVAQKARWSVKYPRIWHGGTLTTAGNLVFQGTAMGWIYGYDARTGKKLWSFNAKNGIIAPPITYSVKGKQYVTVLAGYGGAVVAAGKEVDPGWRYGKHMPRVLTFALDAKQSLPPTPGPDFSVRPVDDAGIRIDTAAAQRGRAIYYKTCVVCHGLPSVGGLSVAPDLRESLMATNFEAFDSVMDGGLKERGMPPWPALTKEEREALFMYIREFTRETIAEQKRVYRKEGA